MTGILYKLDLFEAKKFANSLPSPLGRKWPSGRMSSWFHPFNFLAFSFRKIPSPTVYDGPPSPSWALWYAQIFLLLCKLEAFTELLKALQAM